MAKNKSTKKRSRSISNRKQRQINSGTNLQRRIVTSALRGITDIKVLIHRSVFSGLYSLGTLRKMLGNFGVRDDDPLEEHSRYQFKRDIQLNTGKIKLHFKLPSFGYGPSCLIATNESTYDHLSNIYQRLPKLKITRLEYAMDLFCRDPDAVADLLWLIRRYLYAPGAVRTSMVGGKFFGYKDYARVINAVYYIRMAKFSGKHIKVYERGPDSLPKRGNIGWAHENVDRVRIEFKLQRRAIATKYGLSTLEQLLMDPKFGAITSEYIRFKNFKFSLNLPQDWDDYLSEDEQGNPESFMQEVLSAKDADEVQNIIQYMEDNLRMQALKSHIIAAAAKFDKHWSRGSRRMMKW